MVYAAFLEECGPEKAQIWLVSHWGNIRVVLGLYGDNGIENGNDYNGLHRLWESVLFSRL